MSTFPGSIVSFAGFLSSHTLAADNHAAQHNSEQAEIVAIETKIGTGSSTPISATVLRGTGTGTSSWGQVILTSDVTGILPQGSGGTGTNLATGTGPVVYRDSPVINSPTGTWIQTVYPIGCIYTETTGTNPATTFGFGTWTAFGAGRVLIGNGTSDQAFAAGNTGGESNHTLITAEMPSHAHSKATQFGAAGSSFSDATVWPQVNTSIGGSPGNTGSAGSDGAHNNLQPYIVVYFWKRTA